MENQTLVDMLVLASTDVAAIAMFENARTYFEDGNGAQWETVMRMVVQAIDNTYGIGSFDLYKDTGILPSQQ